MASRESLRAEIERLQDAKRRALAIADAGLKRNADLLAKIARLQRELAADFEPRPLPEDMKALLWACMATEVEKLAAAAEKDKRSGKLAEAVMARVGKEGTIALRDLTASMNRETPQAMMLVACICNKKHDKAAGVLLTLPMARVPFDE